MSRISMAEKIEFLNKHDRMATDAFENSDPDKRKQIIALARKELRYSEKTADVDIGSGLRMANIKRMLQ